MSSSEATLELLKAQRILPLFYHNDATVCAGVVKALYDGGVRLVEFTNRGEHALPRFRELVQFCEESLPGMHLAVGTISTAKDAESFIEAGAKLLISPFWDNTISAIAQFEDVQWIPGCMTPTEIHQAVAVGYNIIKLFPGNVIGTGFVEAVYPVFPATNFIVTGGVDATAASVNAWIKSGVVAVGLGSKLITGDIMNNHQYDELQQRVTIFLSELQPH